ncbi:MULTISPECIES: Rha family transcriptional regulator [Peribacillus]|uniref:Rha family transcriptional regulator n=1 Tax=Peribacillus TaxID=2675229 RepID=UPI001F4DFB88|nr:MULTISPECIES: Rha family transcriptional regulator [unclassified Peribacillus]MCK1982196.1 Rha family transcriptional regulator [Peribacillus sp. Aquil_B1]MCK2007452.1 Rha family transcriptional regulator [Peribacillus sp. Aquil_B8]
MNQLVYIENGQVVTSSLTIAEVFGKEHKNVMADIVNQIGKLVVAGEEEFSRLNFQRSTYKNERGREYDCCLLSEDAFTLIAMSYVTPEAMKFKVKFIKEFKRIKEEITKPRVLSDREQLIASMKLSLETAEEIEVIKNDVELIKHQVSEEITLNHGQQQTLHHEIKKRVESIKDDYDLTKREIYSQIHSHLRRAFSAPKYIFVKRKDYEEAVSWVKSWRPLI